MPAKDWSGTVGNFAGGIRIRNSLFSPLANRNQRETNDRSIRQPEFAWSKQWCSNTTMIVKTLFATGYMEELTHNRCMWDIIQIHTT